jgi:hypothetical protein
MTKLISLFNWQLKTTFREFNDEEHGARRLQLSMKYITEYFKDKISKVRKNLKDEVSVYLPNCICRSNKLKVEAGGRDDGGQKDARETSRVRGW